MAIALPIAPLIFICNLRRIMPEETPAPPESPKSSSLSPRRRSFIGRVRQTLTPALATLKVKGAGLLTDAGEGLIAYSQWLQARTSEADVAQADAVSESVMGGFQSAWQRWSGLLAPVRSRLPKQLRRRLSDSRLTGLLVGLLVFFGVAISSGGNRADTRPDPNQPLRRPWQYESKRRQPKPVQPTVSSRPYQAPEDSADSPSRRSARDIFGDLPDEAEQKATAPVESVMLEKQLDENRLSESDLREDPLDRNSSRENQTAVTAEPTDELATEPATEQAPGQVIAKDEIVSDAEDEINEEGADAIVALLSSDEDSEAQADSAENLTEEATDSVAADSTAAVSDEPELNNPATTAAEPQPEVAEPKPEAPSETPPEVEPLTPEQQRIATLRSQFETAARSHSGLTQDSPDLIRSLDLNSRALTLTLSPAWFELPYEEQDAVAQALFDRVDSGQVSRVEGQRLGKRLRLLDEQGHSLARKAVVGEGIVVLQRLP